MAIFAVLHISAFTYKVYVPEDRSKTTHRWKLVVDAFNFIDFIREFWKACTWIVVGRKRTDSNEFEFVEDDGMISFLKASYRQKYGIDVSEPASSPPDTGSSHGGFVFPWAVTIDKNSQIDLTELPKPSEPKMRVLTTRSRSNSVRKPTASTSAVSNSHTKTLSTEDIENPFEPELKK